jgi:hypothetical protein
MSTLLVGIASSASPPAQILVSDGKTWNGVLTTGDVLIDQTGATTIQDGVVTNSKLASAPPASIKYADLAGNITDLALGAAGTVLQSDGTNLVYAPVSQTQITPVIVTPQAVTITPSQSGSLFTNIGATGAVLPVVLTLPTPSPGLNYSFTVGGSLNLGPDENNLVITVADDGSQLILTNDASMTVQGTFLTGRSDTYGLWSTVKLLAINTTNWIIESKTGTWVLGDAPAEPGPTNFDKKIKLQGKVGQTKLPEVTEVITSSLPIAPVPITSQTSTSTQPLLGQATTT